MGAQGSCEACEGMTQYMKENVGSGIIMYMCTLQEPKWTPCTLLSPCGVLDMHLQPAKAAGKGCFVLKAMGHHPHVCYGNLFMGAKMPHVTHTERPSDSKVDTHAPTQTGARTYQAQPQSCATCKQAHRR
jgi:hypothetical protein